MLRNKFVLVEKTVPHSIVEQNPFLNYEKVVLVTNKLLCTTQLSHDGRPHMYVNISLKTNKKNAGFLTDNIESFRLMKNFHRKYNDLGNFLCFKRTILRDYKEDIKILKVIRIAFSFENMITLASSINESEQRKEYILKSCKRHRNKLTKL